MARKGSGKGEGSAEAGGIREKFSGAVSCGGRLGRGGKKSRREIGKGGDGTTGMVSSVGENSEGGA